jgi:UDP-glucose 4-epimerase
LLAFGLVADPPVLERVLVTGGAGFIGSHVADALLARGSDVLAVDDLSTGDRGNLAGEAAFEQLDICDQSRLREVVSEFRPSLICHLAAQASVTFSVRHPDRDRDVNVVGTYNVCELGREHGAPVVFTSTGGALYGDEGELPAREDSQPEPLSPYGASKLAGEAYVATWGRLHGLPNVVIRPGNVFGPRQAPHGEAGVVAIFSGLLARGESPTVRGDGTPTRDYVHVSDVAKAIIRSAEAGVPGTFNVARGEETSVLELLEILQEAAGTSLEPRFEPLQPGELRRSVLDVSKAERILGWRAEIPVSQGMRDTFRTYRLA